MRVLKGVIFTCLLFSFGLVRSQNMLDSLNRELLQANGKPEREVSIYCKISREIAESNPDSALAIAGKALAITNSLKNDSLFAHVLIAQATAYSFKADYDRSTQLELEALRIGETTHDTTIVLDACNNLGIDFMYVEDYEKSFDYFNRYKSLAALSGDSVRLGHGLNNLGMVEYYRGNSQNELLLYKQAQTIFKQIGEQEGLGNTLLNIGTVYTENGSYDLAEGYYTQALEIFKKLKYTSGYCNVLQSLAENYLDQGNLKQAEKVALQALKILQDNNLQLDVAYTYELLKNIYQEMGSYRLAFEYMEKYHELDSEIFNKEKSRQINELNIKYETAEKEAAIERLELDNKLQQLEISKSRTMLIAISVIAALVLISGVLLMAMRNKRNEAERIAQEHELDALKQRILEIQQQLPSDQISVDLEELNEKLFTPLSEREFEILKHSLEGKSNREVADAVFVSINTVKFHLKNIYQKLGVSNKKEILQYVANSGNE